MTSSDRFDALIGPSPSATARLRERTQLAQCLRQWHEQKPLALLVRHPEKQHSRGAPGSGECPFGNEVRPVGRPRREPNAENKDHLESPDPFAMPCNECF